MNFAIGDVRMSGIRLNLQTEGSERQEGMKTSPSSDARVTDKLHLAVSIMLLKAQRFQSLQYLGYETPFSQRPAPTTPARALRLDAAAAGF